MNEQMNHNQKLASLEALLFVHGEPMETSKIAATLDLPAEEMEGLLSALRERLAAEDRGLALVLSNDSVQLVSKPQFHALLEHFVKDQLTEDLSPATQETLAIISYFGPISRSRIDFQRGVNSSFTLRNLLLRGLIERSPDPKHPQAYLYRPSFELLRHIGVGAQKDLPDYEKFRGLLQQFENQTQA